MRSVVHFDVFSPCHLTHWFIAAYQLLRFKKYWWVVHVGLTFDDNTELSVRLTRIEVCRLQPHDRELYWHPLSPDYERQLMLTVQSEYLLNCACVVSLCTDTAYIHFTPASLYEAALRYTHDLFHATIDIPRGTRTPDSDVTITCYND